MSIIGCYFLCMTIYSITQRHLIQKEHYNFLYRTGRMDKATDQYHDMQQTSADGMNVNADNGLISNASFIIPADDLTESTSNKSSNTNHTSSNISMENDPQSNSLSETTSKTYLFTKGTTFPTILWLVYQIFASCAFMVLLIYWILLAKESLHPYRLISLNMHLLNFLSMVGETVFSRLRFEYRNMIFCLVPLVLYYAVVFINYACTDIFVYSFFDWRESLFISIIFWIFSPVILCLMFCLFALFQRLRDKFFACTKHYIPSDQYYDQINVNDIDASKESNSTHADSTQTKTIHLENRKAKDEDGIEDPIVKIHLTTPNAKEGDGNGNIGDMNYSPDVL